MDTELRINGLNQVFGVVDKEVTDIVIPDGVVSIKPNSFKGCKCWMYIPSKSNYTRECYFNRFDGIR